MIETYQALAVALFALLPGAAYTFAFERIVGSFGSARSDRLVRFLAASAVLQAALSGVTLSLYRNFVITGRLGRAELSGWTLEIASLSYVLVPSALGYLIGTAHKKDWRWSALLVGASPEPRAWDFLFQANTQGIARMQLKDGRWLGGAFTTNDRGRRSYASGYPEAGDLYFSTQLQVDGDTGAFARNDVGEPLPVEGGSGLLIRWDEILYLDFLEI